MPIKKILIIDDSPTERYVLSEFLMSHGFDVVTADNGQSGIEKARKELPNVILMDVVMPGLNGFSATRTIARDKVLRHIPIIVCTAKGHASDKVWGLRQGAFGYLVKPINKEELLTKISML